MLLFPQKDLTHKKNIVDRNFYIFSIRNNINQQLAELLRIAGFSNIEKIKKDIFSLQRLDLDDLNNIAGIIIDIGDMNNIETIIETINSLVPRSVWCAIVGDSDSIFLAQKLASNNLFFFNAKIQLDMLTQTLISGLHSYHSKRKPIIITSLGCKGGIGNTTISYQLINQIAYIRKTPCLAIQGYNVFKDIDLITNKKNLQPGINSLNKHLDFLYKDEEELPNLSHDIYQKYNFILLEHSMVNMDKEKLRFILEMTSCLLLMVDRSLTSLRNARSIIDNYEQFIRNSPNKGLRLFICLNNTRPALNDMLAIEDINSLLGRSIDINIPYIKNMQITNSRSYNKNCLLLTNLVLGISSKPKLSSFLTRLRHKI